MAASRRLQAMGVTAREADVLAALGDRLTNPDIAALLCVSKRTVESHVGALLRKLDAPDRAALVALAGELTGPVEVPATQFVTVEGSYVAWSSFGQGRPVLFLPQWTSNIETIWQEPGFVTFATMLGEVARVTQFDKRGCGASDGRIGTIEDATAEAVAVLDAAQPGPVVVVAGGLCGFLGIRVATAHPERVAGLVLVDATACVQRVDGYDIGFERAELRTRFARTERAWIAAPDEAATLPTSDAPYREVGSPYRRSSAKRSELGRLALHLESLDFRDEIRLVRCPTLVIHRQGNQFLPVTHGRYLASEVPTASLRELPGADHTPWAGDQAAMVGAIEAFLHGLDAAGSTVGSL